MSPPDFTAGLRADLRTDFRASFRAGLADGTVPAGTSPDLPQEAAQRFAVYRNNVAHSLSQALSRRFPVIERLVGQKFFVAMAREFIAAHPPTSPVLQEWGDAFPGFLERFPPVGSLPYLPAVAAIEWARGQSYHAADAAPIAPEDLHRIERPRLHPSVQVLRCNHPAVSIWQANQPGQNGRVSVSGHEIALIWRKPDLSVGTVAIAAPQAAMIEALQNGATLESAALVTDPVPVLSLLLREQLLCIEEG